MKYAISDSDVSIEHPKMGTRYVTEALAIGDDIQTALGNHAPSQVYWYSLLADEERRLKAFKEGSYEAYMSHVRRYAKYTLRGTGDKDTLESVKDNAVILFSKNKLGRETLKPLTYLGYLITLHGTATAANKWKQTLPVDQAVLHQETFFKEMYLYEDEGIYYNDMIDKIVEIEANTDVLRAVAEAFSQRGVMLSSLAAIMREERSAYSAEFIRKVASQVSEVIRNKT